MATIRLVPSTYYLSSSSYLSVSDASNMYHNTDNSTYATVKNSQNGTTSYYIYLRGFNFDDVPSTATINSFTIKLKARESGITTSTSYYPRICNGTSTLTGSCSMPGTSEKVLTFSNLQVDYDTIKGYGSDFGIRINCRRASKNTTGYMYIYGAEIEVDYTVPDPCTITSTLTGDGTISPSGAYNTYKDVEYELTITPTNKSDEVTVKHDGVDVTSQIVPHGVGSDITATPDNVTTSSIQSGSSYASYAVGHSAESPSSSGSGQNMYASSGSTGYAEYTFDFSGIPSGATIEEIEVRCYGHRESSTISSTYVSKCGIYLDGTLISDYEEFPSTSDSIITLTPNDVPTLSQMGDVTIRHYVGYYGGLVRGISFVVTYSTGSGIDHYTYTFTTTGDATIAVTIGSAEKDTLYVKIGGVWKEVATVYKKINGSWVEQSDVTMVFNSNTNYVKGN